MQDVRKSVRQVSEAVKRIDIHIHAVGDANDRCYIAKSLLRKIWFRLIANRLDIKSLAEYVPKLVQYLRESPVDIGVILAFDAIYDERGNRDPKTAFYIPNSFIFKVTAQYLELLPGISVHPNRTDALEELDKCVEAGAVLVKWIPNAQGIDPSNKKYIAFYRKLAEYKLPLLSHAGYEFTLPTVNQDLGNPEKLRLPLEEGVTVIASHSGISYSGFSTKYMKVWLSLLKEYPNLYGDVGASSIGIAGHYVKKLLEDQLVCQRLVNGSDFPIPPLKSVSDFFRKSNPFTRDFDIKRRLGVSDDVFHRGCTLLRT